MREIKFRLYNNYDKQMYIFNPRWGNFGHGFGWVGGVLEEDYERNGRTFSPSNQIQLEPESCEWLEFTGLLDKNGKEVYEGDLYMDKGCMYPIEVYYDERTAGFKGRVNGEMQIDKTYHLMWHKSWEVIGNIYQNKELLK